MCYGKDFVLWSRTTESYASYKLPHSIRCNGGLGGLIFGGIPYYSHLESETHPVYLRKEISIIETQPSFAFWIRGMPQSGDDTIYRQEQHERSLGTLTCNYV